MGGTVNVKSELGKGTTFSIILTAMVKIPTNDIKEPTLPELISLKSNISMRQNNINKQRLLIANDNLYLLLGYKELLKDYFLVDTAENGLQAVQIVCNHEPSYFQCIILDINMPIMNGYEACQRIDEYLNEN